MEAFRKASRAPSAAERESGLSRKLKSEKPAGLAASFLAFASAASFLAFASLASFFSRARAAAAAFFFAILAALALSCLFLSS